MAATLKIIAERAGLAQSTVSQILNRRAHDFSSEEKRQLVFRLAHELGYKQKFGHKLLRGDKTQTVGLLLSTHRSSLEEYMQALILRLLDELERRGYGSYFVTLSDEEENNLRIVRDLIGRGADCFIMLGAPVGYGEIEAEIRKNSRNMIAFNHVSPRRVEEDHSRSCGEILRFFLDEGRTNFRMLLSEPFLFEEERLRTLKMVFPDVPGDELLRRYCVGLGHLGEHDDIDLFARIGYEKTREVMEQDPSVSAIFYLSDYFAVGGIKYLTETGCKIGSDVLVAGFNNIHAIRTHCLPVTSAEHALTEIADALVEEMDKSDDTVRTIYSKAVIRKV